MSDSHIKKELNNIKDLPTLPAIALELNRMLQDNECTVDKVAGKIESDQSIASKVLKLINSAFFGLRSQVTNIHNAVVLLGFNSIRNIVLSVSVIKAFSDGSGKNGVDMTEFWNHSIATAMTAKYLAEVSGIGDAEDCFTTGLLHDIGKIVLAQYFSEIFFRIVDEMEDQNIPFSKAEKSHLDRMGHARVGGFLSDKWKFPAALTRSIEGHHSVTGTLTDLETITHIADIIVNIHSINNSSLEMEQRKSRMPVMNMKAVEAMKNYIGTSATWYPELSEKIKDACSFFAE